MRYGFSLLFLFLPLLLVAQEAGRFLGAKETHYPAWFKESFLDIREDVDEAREAGRRVLLFFHQNGCPYCNLMVERNLSQRQIERQMQEQFDVIAVNMWGDRAVTDLAGRERSEKLFAADLEVQFTPTLLFLDEGGEVVLRLNGYLPPADFQLALNYVGRRLERDQSFRDYVLANRPQEPDSGPLQAQPFFVSPPHDLSLVREPIAIFFEQRDCPACRRLHRELLADPEIAGLVGRTHAVQLDMWSDTPLVTPDGERLTAREWARRLSVSYAPTLVLFDPEAGEVIRSEAFFKRFHTASIFDYLLSGAFRGQPSFQRYLSARAEHIREQGKDVDIWQ
ncbi:MAG: thioredoxin fold domain-containing protein [Sedimenticola sp.]|nr:thioredoxin fold domain-containing protein [Sedimenticola sp.]